MTLTPEQAREIVDLLENIAEFREPPDSMPDRAADKLFRQRDYHERRLRTLCIDLLVQRVVDEARQMAGA